MEFHIYPFPDDLRFSKSRDFFPLALEKKQKIV